MMRTFTFYRVPEFDAHETHRRWAQEGKEMPRKTIVITWTEKRAWLPTYNGQCAALWAADGTDRDLNEALRYIAGQDGYRVHTFATDDPDWKRKALVAHAAGRSL